jgi:Sulfotransferase domain
MEGLPNLIIAGVGKAGTTSLFWYLSQLPDVAASDVKEIQYFTPLSEGDGVLAPLSEYARHFRGAQGARYRLEASPQYFHGGQVVVDAMQRTLDRPRVIVMLRDPIARLWSQFRFMNSRLADLPEGMTFEAYVAACRQVRERHEAFSRENRLYWTIEGGFYVDYLDPWVDGFGDDLRVVFFEQMAALPEEVTRDLSTWLELDPDAAAGVNYSVENRTIQYRSRLLQRVALAANKEGALGGRRRLKEPLRRVYYRLNRKPEAEAMSEDTRAELRALFAPGNAALAARLRGLGYHQLPDWLG